MDVDNLVKQAPIADCEFFFKKDTSCIFMNELFDVQCFSALFVLFGMYFPYGAPLSFSFLTELNACMHRSIPVQKALLDIERWLEHPAAKSSM
jgi:hypothetical protein